MHFFIAIVLLLLTPALQAAPVTLQVFEKDITVNHKNSKVFAIEQPDGTFGYTGTKGDIFDVTVENNTSQDLVLHWHGITSPNRQDGVPFVTQYPIKPGEHYRYHFKLKQAGTYWLHSHYKLQEQRLMAAPLIIHENNVTADPEAIMFIQDFSFTDPKELYAKLRNKLQSKTMMKMDMNKPDVNDVKFDAYLTNHRTLQDPDIIKVEADKTLRLRIINASASSNYFIDLGKLTGVLIAIDGADIMPVQGSRFQIAIGDRLDISVKIPAGEGAYPILALPEGTKQQTGLILATAKSTIPKLSETTKTENDLLDYSQELQVHAAHPFSNHKIQQSLLYKLEGNMSSYEWSMNGEEWPFIRPSVIKAGQRIEMVFDNKTDMPHPMHFHGHVFQITEINGQKIKGRQGDTIDVLPHSRVKLAFDSDNPGIWMLHCHILYHQAGGMMTTVNYDHYPNRFTLKQRLEGEKLYN